MRDGRTREIPTEGGENSPFAEFLTRFQPSVVILSGSAKGTEFTVDHERVTIGRGPGVDLAFADDSMSREHAALEFTREGFCLRDLESTNGTLLNGGALRVGEIKHGDKFQLGDLQFQFVVEERERRPQAYEIPED